MSHTLLGGAGRKGWSLSWIVVFSPSHEHLTFRKGGVIHQEDTVLSEMKQLFCANRLAVSITALSGTLKCESLLGLWKRRKKYTTENPCLHRVSSCLLINKSHVLQHISKKRIKPSGIIHIYL